MRNFPLLFFTALLAAHAATRSIHSHLLVDAGKQFALGGDQVGPFRVNAHNTGRMPVLLVRDLGRERADLDHNAKSPSGSPMVSESVMGDK